MGCSPSKSNNIETMNQCKERKTFLKQSISACNAFANANFAYATVLKNTGSALSDYAHDELQSNDNDLSCVPPHPSSYDTLSSTKPATKENVAREFFSTLMGDVRLVEVDDDQVSRVEIPMIWKKRVEIQSEHGGVKKSSPIRSSSNIVENSKLLDVFTELDDGFLKASESSLQVLKILKANQLHHHSIFADDQGHINHSKRFMHVITWNKSFERPQITNAVKGEFASKGKESLVTLLDKMLAWEIKLYDQMKTGQAMKVAYQKKVASLDKLKKRGASIDVLEKTKAAASHMQTRYIVDLQFIDSTIAEIIRLRDQQLYPKLVQLVKEMGIMWDNMRKQHERQLKIVQTLHNIEISQLKKGVCECNLINTQLLQFHLKVWCCEFEKLIQHEKIYIKSFMYWLKLNLVLFDNKSSSTKQAQNRKMVTLLCTWQENLEKLPEEETKTAINKLACMINTMAEYQSEEMRLKKICDETQQEIIKKSRKFEEWCDKKISKRTTHTDELDDIDVMDDMEAIAEQQFVTEALKKRLEAEEKMYRQKCVEVKEKSLMNMKNGLQDVFRAMYEFSCACSCMYGNLNSNASS